MTRSFTYDAENRQVTACINCQPNVPTATYAYDGAGLRVSKVVGSQTTVYVFDAFGYLAAEYSSQSSTSPCGTATCYLTFDHLGSTRMLTDTAGSNGTASSNVLRYDYLPFGGELLASTNGRTTAMGYSSAADVMNPKFTGKNRDAETFLDWYEVRFMSGAQGRFQSPDPGNAGASLGNPQTWNAYSYVGNNPLSYTDPSGQGFSDILAGVVAGVGAFLATGNPVVGAKVGLTVAGLVESIDSLAHGQIPGGDLFGSSYGVSSLTGCGGPLGNCGTLGNAPWSENPQLGNVQDPGRFVFQACPSDRGCDPVASPPGLPMSTFEILFRLPSPTPRSVVFVRPRVTALRNPGFDPPAPKPSRYECMAIPEEAMDIYRRQSPSADSGHGWHMGPSRPPARRCGLSLWRRSRWYS
jgi:RHS repeat-associated protein